MRIGLAGAFAIGAAIVTIVLAHAAYNGNFLGLPLFGATIFGLVSLGWALWSGSTRWLLLLLPILLAPATLVVILYNCSKCIA